MTTTLPTSASRPSVTLRLTSIDIVRGSVMVLMAIDHVRVYSGVPAGGPTAGVFFTRWVTHFCAPVFVFFAGIAAFLRAYNQIRPKPARFLITRGLLLVVLELTVIRLSWTFSAASLTSPMAGVIWMLGWCMVLLAPLTALPARIVGAIGIAIVAAQDLLRLMPASVVAVAPWFWNFLYLGDAVPLTPAGANGPAVTVLYTIVPWVGVMAAGYGFGGIMVRDNAARRRLCSRIGLGATALFLLFGIAGVVAASPGDGDAPALFQLLDQRKYPASPLFLLMTLGPAIAVLPYAEHARGRIAGWLAVFGRVPLFYYLLHIPLIHGVALFVWWLRDGTPGAARFASAPYVDIPPDERWSLLLLYTVFAASGVILYFACERFAALKARRPGGWLTYL